MIRFTPIQLMYWAMGACLVALVAIRLLKRFGLWPGSAAKRRPSAPKVPKVPKVPKKAVAAPPPVAEKPVAPTPGPKEPAAATPAVTAPPAAAAARVSSMPRSSAVSWADRKLFDSEGGEAEPSVPRVEPDDVPAADTSDYVLGELTPAVAAMLPETDERRRQWKKDLRAAGYLSPRAWQNFAAVRYLCVVIPMLALGVALVLVPPRLEMAVAIGIVVVPLLGWSLPALRVRSQAADRKHEIERGMPDLIDMLNMCVSQGLTLPAALRRVRRQIAEPYPALGTEIGIVIEQTDVGSLRQALLNFADRIDVPEVHSFTNLLTQTDRMGTSVSEALRVHSDGLRESLRQRADEKANRASFRLLFPTVLCLMPAVYLVLMGPAVVELNKFFSEGGGRDIILQGRDALQGVDQPTTAGQ